MPSPKEYPVSLSEGQISAELSLTHRRRCIARLIVALKEKKEEGALLLVNDIKVSVVSQCVGLSSC